VGLIDSGLNSVLEVNSADNQLQLYQKISGPSYVNLIALKQDWFIFNARKNRGLALYGTWLRLRSVETTVVTKWWKQVFQLLKRDLWAKYGTTVFISKRQFLTIPM
jgi:hypothetical protein